nr:unnamed protein product [Spirometra erinaceieuropaei]
MMGSRRNPKRQADKALVSAMVSPSSRLLSETRLFASIGNFTSIPPDLGREVLQKRLENALKIEHLMRLFEFCQQTFLTFAGETYEQIEGTPVDSLVSGLVAELVLQELEKTAFLQHESVSWRRYVDDTFVIVKKDMLQHFHSLLNAVFSDIKFMREE